MKEMIEKKQRNEDIDALYAELVEHRKKRKIYMVEQKELYEKQFNMQQNFIKMIDRNITYLEDVDPTFLKDAEKLNMKDDIDNGDYNNPYLHSYQNVG